MVKIALLNANIVRIQGSESDLSAGSFKTTRLDLELWYTHLPKDMHLSRLTREDIPIEARRSTFHVHLLYLGAIILLHRHMASQLVQTYNQDKAMIQDSNEAAFVEAFRESHSAAQHSATLLKLMLSEGHVFKHCWVVIFQSYATSIILLYWIVQNMLYDFPNTSIPDDLEKTKHCLASLAYCGAVDPVAYQFHHILVSLYEDIASAYANFSGPQRITEASKIRLNDELPSTLFQHLTPKVEETTIHALSTQYFAIPLDADPVLKICSLRLLYLIAQPFSSIDDINRAIEEDLVARSWAVPARYNSLRLVSEFICRNEQNRSVHWDLSNMISSVVGVPDSAASHETGASLLGRFLGSMRPSGWHSTSCRVG
jgi:hypothetical protein